MRGAQTALGRRAGRQVRPDKAVSTRELVWQYRGRRRGDRAEGQDSQGIVFRILFYSLNKFNNIHVQNILIFRVQDGCGGVGPPGAGAAHPVQQEAEAGGSVEVKVVGPAIAGRSTAY